MIHGLFSSSKKFDREKRALEKAGHNVVVINYKTDLPWKMNQEIDRKLKSHSDADLFIGHSYGGLYLAQNRNIKSNKIVTINSPGVRRGHNYQNVDDPLSVIDPISSVLAESHGTGGHGKLPTAMEIISRTSNDDRVSPITYVNRAITDIYEDFENFLKKSKKFADNFTK